MAKKRKNMRLAAGELDILRMLWRHDGVTILEAQQSLGLPIGYTTVQTRLNRLVKKGVAGKSKQRPAKYRAVITPDDVSTEDLDLLVERVNEGHVVPLVAHLVNRRALNMDELKELKELIAEAESRIKARRRKGAKK